MIIFLKLMKRPSNETLAQIGQNASIMDFLIANKITALEPIVKDFFQLNGYG